MKKTMRFYLSTIIFLLTAVQAFSQLTGNAVAPVVSTAESPVYYMIESASDGSYTFSGFTGDFRGNVMISPASPGKISYNKPSVAPSPDHTLWQLIDVNGTTLLKNKATGLYMVGSHSVNASGSAFSATVISGMQYKIVTADAGSSYAITWKNNLCDRITVGIQENSLTAWYFTSNETLNDLEIAILANEYVYAKSPAGTNPGTYSNEDRAIYRAVIDAAISLNNDNDATEEEIENAIAALEAAKNTFLASRNEIKLSTENDEVWYYIENAHPTYGVGKVLVNQNNEPETSILFTSKSLDPNKLWKFIDAGNGKVAIQNMASSLYISANPRNQGSSSTAVGFNVTWLGEDAQFLFKADGQDYLHAQEAGSLLVTWGTNTLNSGSAWKLDELPAEDINKPVTIENITLSQGIYTTTGIGNKDHGLAYITISTSGLIGEVSLNSITVDLDGTNNIGAVDNLKLYHTGSTNRLNPAEHQLIAQVNKPATTSTAVEIVLNEPLSLSIGSTIIYIATDVSDNANEGDILDNRVLSAKYDDSEQNNKVYTLASNTTPLASTVFLKRVVVFAPGDDGAVSYRIPAITTADDGTLITLTDKRKNHSGDLPADIDILAKRSTDNGKTWSEPILVAQGTPNHGYGDAAIIKAKSGKIVALFVGDNGLFQSNPSKLIRTYISTSDDNGLTWSEVRDITSQIYGPECSDPVRNKWDGLFFGSGHALSLRDGRIMAVVAVREPGMSGLQNYAVYSDDEGETWEVSARAIQGGDEAKVVELNDGTVLMSSRAGGNRLWSKSTDRGETWGPKNSWTEIWGNACDADIIRYTSTLDGYDKDRLLHTLPNAGDRRNLTMWISYDEGSTWGTKKTLCPGTSAYSSITILPDGTIGVYFEEDGSLAYTMTFINFSLEWLTNGVDTYIPSSSTSTKDNSLSQISVYSEKGRIKVNGTDSPFQIYNLTGQIFNAKDKLDAGVYLVNVDDEVFKVLVK